MNLWNPKVQSFIWNLMSQSFLRNCLFWYFSIFWKKNFELWGQVENNKVKLRICQNNKKNIALFLVNVNLDMSSKFSFIYFSARRVFQGVCKNIALDWFIWELRVSHILSNFRRSCCCQNCPSWKKRCTVVVFWAFIVICISHYV